LLANCDFNLQSRTACTLHGPFDPEEQPPDQENYTVAAIAITKPNPQEEEEESTSFQPHQAD